MLFRKPQCKATSKQGKKIKVLQNNVGLFGQLYISMQNRDGDLAEFFAHDSLSLLPSQTLASFICQTRSMTCCNVLSSLSNRSHLQPTTAKSWMMQSSSTACPLPASAPSMSMHLPGEAAAGYHEIGCCVGHIHTRQFEGVYPGKERQGCPQKSVGRDQAARQLDGLPQ